jgi:hypothetical protein
MVFKSTFAALALGMILVTVASAQPVASNAPLVVTNTVYVTNAAPSLDLNPADIVDLVPAKYAKLATLLVGLLLMGGRIVASMNAGGTLTAALGNLIKGHSQSAHNEIANLKNVLNLPPTAAPPAPPTPAGAPTPAPINIPTFYVPPIPHPVFVPNPDQTSSAPAPVVPTPPVKPV